MTRTSRALPWLAVVGAALGACDPVYTVCATVRDCATGKPLEGVHVIARLTDGRGGDTDSAGTYCTGEMGTTPASYTLEASKAGYQDRSLDVANGQSQTDLCLAPLACIPGTSVACRCSDGAAGVQLCNGEGSALGECLPCGADAGVD